MTYQIPVFANVARGSAASNRVSLTILFFVIFCSNMYADNFDTGQYKEHYNYYSRNIDGSFILKNIPSDTFPVPLFSYSAIYEDNQIAKIVGYYYQTNTVKFIDDITFKHIVKSTYINYETGAPFYTKELFYNQQWLLISMFIKFFDDNYKKCEIKSTFEYIPENDKFRYAEIEVNEFRDDIIQDNIDKGYPVQLGNLYSEINGVVTKNFQPINLHRKAKQKLGDQSATTNYEEIFDYANDGVLLTHTVSSNHKTVLSMSVIYDKLGYTKITQQFDMRGNAYLIRKQEKVGDIYISSTEKDSYNGISEPRIFDKVQYVTYTDDLFLEYFYSGDDFKDKNGRFALVSNDERIIFDQNLHIVDTSIKFSLSVFPERIYMFRNVSKIYTAKNHNVSQ